MYPRILGRNTLGHLDVSTHHRSGTLSDGTGKTWKMWPYSNERSFLRAVEDYARGILSHPKDVLTDDELFQVRSEAASEAGVFTGDPDYSWSERRFGSAEVNRDRYYFAHAVLHDCALVQRCLKRDARPYPNFITYLSAWFRRCPQLKNWWDKLWIQGNVGHPKLSLSPVRSRRASRLESFGLSPRGLETRDPVEATEVARAVAEVEASWQTEEDSMHLRIATCKSDLEVNVQHNKWMSHCRTSSQDSSDLVEPDEDDSSEEMRAFQQKAVDRINTANGDMDEDGRFLSSTKTKVRKLLQLWSRR